MGKKIIKKKVRKKAPKQGKTLLFGSLKQKSNRRAVFYTSQTRFYVGGKVHVPWTLSERDLAGVDIGKL